MVEMTKEEKEVVAGPAEAPQVSDVTIEVEVGYPRCRAIARVMVGDKEISEAGMGRSNRYGTELATKHAKDEALARLKVAVAVANQILKSQENG